MDIFRFNRRKILIAGGITALCCALMVVFPTIALYSARKGISLWITNVLPALLPFFICANFLQKIGVVRCLKSGVFPFAMSVLSGYPMGAKIVGDLKRSGEITTDEAKRLMSFCSTSGPAFMAGAVGAGMLGSGILGAVIVIAHYGGALLNGFFYSRLLKVKKGQISLDTVQCRVGIQDAFTESILSSFRALGIILAYIVIFMFVTDILHMCGAFSILEDQGLRALAKGFFEMTVGCGAVAECGGLTDSAKCILCSLITSWGGLSVIGQSMSMLAGTEVSLTYLLVSKLTHSLFSAGVAFFISILVL
ncbi:MAG: hypothetical protein GX663_08370 [Clostridiales bacterium]|nr:hypothetical protein [Clostridiales bacterium]